MFTITLVYKNNCFFKKMSIGMLTPTHFWNDGHPLYIILHFANAIIILYLSQIQTEHGDSVWMLRRKNY